MVHGSAHAAVASGSHSTEALTIVDNVSHREWGHQADDVTSASSDDYQAQVPSCLADGSRGLQQECNAVTQCTDMALCC